MLKAKRLQRQKRVRAKIHGTKEMPRVSVFRSNRFLYAQAIDDDNGKTIAYVSERELKEKKVHTDNSKELGNALAEKLKKLKIVSIIFDKGAFKYHGRVKAFADGIREGGLKF